MGDKTSIEWTDATWNPIRGCSRVSEGCRHCYAEGVAMRFSGPGLAYEGLVRIGGNGKPQGWNGQVRFVERHLLDPLRWNKPRRIFVNSMSDLFHESVTDEMRDRVFAVMAAAQRHTFQILTKRPERMREYVASDRTRRAVAQWWKGNNRVRVPDDSLFFHEWPLPNVWLGVSVEDQAAADKRIPELLQTPAVVRFLSMEPLLGSVLFKDHWQRDPGEFSLAALDWVIVGGESGRGARPMHPDWARSVRDQCAAAGVPFFFKQWGEYGDATNDEAMQRQGRADQIFASDGTMLGAGYKDRRGAGGMLEADWRERGGAWMSMVGKKAAGHLLDGVEHRAFPAVR